jgi:hypothetical protein
MNDDIQALLERRRRMRRSLVRITYIYLAVIAVLILAILGHTFTLLVG